ncbi:MAG: AbrB/MazE/SpoVT family DNA-binding domain-containing protein [Terriglobia bacterium]
MKVETGTVTVKGQVVIPAPLRRRLGIKKGTVVSFLEENGHIVVQPVTREFVRRLRGSLKGSPSTLEHLIEERRKERVL